MLTCFRVLGLNFNKKNLNRNSSDDISFKFPMFDTISANIKNVQSEEKKYMLISLSSRVCDTFKNYFKNNIKKLKSRLLANLTHKLISIIKNTFLILLGR